MSKRLMAAAAIILIMIAAFLLYQKKDRTRDDTLPTPSKSSLRASEFISYKQNIEIINGNRQVINVLEVNTSDSNILIQPALSQDSIFGFEKTSSIAERTNAYAAVNGGFFHSYGQPSGFIILNGKLICTPQNTGTRPVFIIDEKGKVFLEDIVIDVLIKIDDKELQVNGINREPRENEIIVFTPEYSITTRMDYIKTYNILIENDVIYDVIVSDQEIRIPRGGFVLTATGQKMKTLEAFLSATDKRDQCKIELIYNTKPTFGHIMHAFEGGFWVVKDGKIVIRETEGWVGLTTNREPRTVIGIKDDYTVVLLTVDGRQPGYSIGLTGKELAGYLLDNGIDNALMLDGGSSTTMVVQGVTINKPSFRGDERMVGGAVIIQR